MWRTHNIARTAICIRESEYILKYVKYIGGFCKLKYNYYLCRERNRYIPICRSRDINREEQKNRIISLTFNH